MGYWTFALTSTYHHDMVVMLNEMQKKPLGLTKTGNLQRAEIKKLGSLFKYDIYHRDENGEILFPITTEHQTKHILCLRALAKIIYLSYNRKGKMHLSKNGKGFLEHISPGVQLTHLFLTFVNQLSWDYLHPGQSNGKSISSVLQRNSNYIFEYLLKSPTDSFDFKVFCTNLGEYFQCTDPHEMPDENGDTEWWLRLCVELTLIRELELFGIVTTTTAQESRTNTRVTSFTVTPNGRHLLARVFEDTWGY